MQNAKDRRNFLKLSAASAFGLNLSQLSLASATTADYKALVCVFLSGGNDAHNTVLATDDDSWDRYLAARGSGSTDSIALKRTSTSVVNGSIPSALGPVLRITPISTTQANRNFALHPVLKKTQSLFNAGKLAVVANVGPLIQPISKQQYLDKSLPIPSKLFSHNDQQSTWMAFSAEGAQTGWGGNLADVFYASNNNSPFSCISAGGNWVFLSGQQTASYRVSPTGAIGAIPINSMAYSNLYGSTAVKTAHSELMQGSGSYLLNHLLEKDYAKVVKNSVEAGQILNSAIASSQSAIVQDAPPYINPVTGAADTNLLAAQFKLIARIIAARDILTVKKQVFLVHLGGFDNHDFQNTEHTNLLGKLDHALDYFNTELTRIGVQDKVTTFTASDFGRTLTSNGDGCDHGWGAHHFIMGGAVKGKDVYGTYPIIGVTKVDGSSNPDAIGGGVMIPTTSVDQYGATLGKWFGVSTGLNNIFPHLANFATKDLGFMKP